MDFIYRKKSQMLRQSAEKNYFPTSWLRQQPELSYPNYVFVSFPAASHELCDLNGSPQALTRELEGADMPSTRLVAKPGCKEIGFQQISLENVISYYN